VLENVERRDEIELSAGKRLARELTDGEQCPWVKRRCDLDVSRRDVNTDDAANPPREPISLEPDAAADIECRREVLVTYE